VHGGLFPEHPDLAAVRNTLDVACGPGSWASEMAYTYPDMQVTGIDISENMIRSAQEMARVQRLENVHFQVMDATQPLGFADNSAVVSAKRVGPQSVRAGASMSCSAPAVTILP